MFSKFYKNLNKFLLLAVCISINLCSAPEYWVKLYLSSQSFSSLIGDGSHFIEELLPGEPQEDKAKLIPLYSGSLLLYPYEIYKKQSLGKSLDHESVEIQEIYQYPAGLFSANRYAKFNTDTPGTIPTGPYNVWNSKPAGYKLEMLRLDELNESYEVSIYSQTIRSSSSSRRYCFRSECSRQVQIQEQTYQAHQIAPLDPKLYKALYERYPNPWPSFWSDRETGYYDNQEDLKTAFNSAKEEWAKNLTDAFNNSVGKTADGRVPCLVIYYKQPATKTK